MIISLSQITLDFDIKASKFQLAMSFRPVGGILNISPFFKDYSSFCINLMEVVNADIAGVISAPAVVPLVKMINHL